MSDLLAIYKDLKEKTWVDLTHQINEESPHFPALPALEKETLFTLDDGFLVHQFKVVTQYGTHIDAPIHFAKGGRYLDEIDLKDTLLPLYVVDLSDKVAENPDYELTKADLLEFEEKHGQILPESFVAFRSDWSKRWPDTAAVRNLDKEGVQHTPGWSKEAIEFLINERNIKAIGHETLDTDAGVRAAQTGFLYNELYLLEEDRFQVENLKDLDKVPASGALISISYPNWSQAAGSPVRAIAILP